MIGRRNSEKGEKKVRRRTEGWKKNPARLIVVNAPLRGERLLNASYDSVK